MRVTGEGGAMKFTETAAPAPCVGKHVRIAEGAFQGIEGSYICDNNGGRVIATTKSIAASYDPFATNGFCTTN